MNKPRVYVAHPQVSYGTVRERTCLAALRSLLPGWDLFNPSGRYTTDTGWLRAWPRVLDTLDGLVIFGTRKGVIGCGCLRELADAERDGLPIAALDRSCHPCRFGGFSLTGPQSIYRTPRRAAVLTPGRRIEDLSAFLGKEAL